MFIRLLFFVVAMTRAGDAFPADKVQESRIIVSACKERISTFLSGKKVSSRQFCQCTIGRELFFALGLNFSVHPVTGTVGTYACFQGDFDGNLLSDVAIQGGEGTYNFVFKIGEANYENHYLYLGQLIVAQNGSKVQLDNGKDLYWKEGSFHLDGVKLKEEVFRYPK
jgi:hypothetical protein